MSYHNIRDNKGRFTRQAVAVAPPAPKRRYSKVRPSDNKVKDTIVLNAFILDDSGSMAWKANATIEGFNGILAAARQAEHDTKIPSKDFLGKFGSPGNFRWFEDVTPIDGNSYKPGQPMTALYEAIIQGITALEAQVVKYASKIVKPILTIFTDGQENVNNYSYHTVKQKVEEKIAQGWVIAYVGAGDQKIVERDAQHIGIYASNSLGYTNDVAGTTRSMRMSASANSSYRSKVAAGTDSVIGFFSKE